MIKKYIYISFIYIILFKITTILHDESAPSELKSDGSTRYICGAEVSIGKDRRL